MWNFAWILGITLAVLLAPMSAMICEARECGLEDERIKSGGSSA